MSMYILFVVSISTNPFQFDYSALRLAPSLLVHARPPDLSNDSCDNCSWKLAPSFARRGALTKEAASDCWKIMNMEIMKIMKMTFRGKLTAAAHVCFLRLAAITLLS